MEKNHNNLSKKDIYEKYIKEGFSNFKIEGRTLSPYEIALNYVKYMVKDEYKEYVAYLLTLNSK